MKSRRKSNVRASISFPAEIYETLEEVARQKKVSLAWVVRDAAEKYLAERHTSANEQEPKREFLG
jgi:metal-responsive CopG/Arc/MetJ family transcriptional regulator